LTLGGFQWARNCDATSTLLNGLGMFGVRTKKYIEHQVSELDTNPGIFFPIHQIITLMCWALNLDPSSQKSSVPKELQFEGVRSLRGR